MRGAQLAVLLAIALAAACQPVPEPEGPRGPQDAAVLGPAEPGACESACGAYRRLGCEEGEPTPRGATCEDVCRNASESGINLAPDAACFGRASSCDEARRCAGD